VGLPANPTFQAVASRIATTKVRAVLSRFNCAGQESSRQARKQVRRPESRCVGQEAGQFLGLAANPTFQAVASSTKLCVKSHGTAKTWRLGGVRHLTGVSQFGQIHVLIVIWLHAYKPMVIASH
jgi:hypothetical protein